MSNPEARWDCFEFVEAVGNNPVSVFEINQSTIASQKDPVKRTQALA